MRALESTLRDYAPDLLRIIASRWDVDLPPGDTRLAAQTLAAAMLEPARGADTWSRLDEAARGALQTLHAAGGRMTAAQFARIFGEIREMGPIRRRKEAPYRSPANLAEDLFYRGLIGTAFDQNDAGVMTSFTYIPTDLRAVLPFSTLGATATPPPGESAAGPVEPLPIDASAVDDVATLLAYLQLNALTGALRGVDQASLRPHLLGPAERARLALLLNLVVGLELVAPDEDGVFRVARGPARAWLEASRAGQTRILALAWCESVAWNDLRHVPGLVCEQTGWQNDPLLTRQAVFHFLAMLPPDEWWSLDSFVTAVKDEAPDFQRPTGEWDSWYIRDGQTGEYLRGFESWDRVDGALIRFLLAGPMRWLGLTQLDAGGGAFRLTGAGLAALGLAPWEDAPEPSATLAVQPDGAVTAPRALSRYDRFQLARVADWEGTEGERYTYRFTADSLRRARAQGVEVGHILAFLRRTAGDQVPPPLVEAMQSWAEHGAQVTLSEVVVMRVSSPEVLARLQAEPTVNRYLGRPLGPMAVEVQLGAWLELRGALQTIGILPEVLGLDEESNHE
jgi:hypothetical protein